MKIKSISRLLALGLSFSFLVGCYGEHPNSVIACWEESNRFGWSCSASSTDAEGEFHEHEVSARDYIGRYRGCKERNGTLTADITVVPSQSPPSTKDEIVVTNVRCVTDTSG